MQLKDFLEEQAKQLLAGDNFCRPIVCYSEDVNHDAANGDAWLERGTSYVWKVGVLSVVDGNKRDWGYLFIGHQRDPGAPFEFIGQLHYASGENDDPGRCIRRAIECADATDILWNE